jgi:hypothetical protein
VGCGSLRRPIGFNQDETSWIVLLLYDVKRSDIKIENFEETKLLNFFSVTGINFQNVASNDAMISAKLNEMSAAGWTLSFISTGVESNAGTTDGEGIFITRFIFKR